MRVTQNDELVQFAGGLAHELANIFTAAAGNLSLLDENCRNCKNCGQALLDIRQATKRGFDITTALKAIAGRQILSPAIADLNPEIGSALKRWQAGQKKKINMTFKPSAEPCHAAIDCEHFHSIIHILADHAAETMPQGGNLHVATRIESDEDGNALIRIDFRDTGLGMTETMMRHAFDPLTTSRRPDLRNGWGLAICAGFVRQSGGMIELDSKPRHGTCVTIWLPKV